MPKLDSIIANIFDRTVEVFRENHLTTRLSSKTPPYKPLIGAKFISFGFVLDSPTKIEKLEKLTEAIAYAANVQQVMFFREKGTAWLQYELDPIFWKSYKFDDETINKKAVGVGSSGLITADFNVGNPHYLIAGSTGSGKSEMVKTLLAYFMTKYSADELRVAVIDPHKDLNYFEGLNHLITRATTPDEIAHLIAAFRSELTKRIKVNYRRGTRLVLVLDEAQDISVLGDKDAFNEENYNTVKELAAQARKFLIHLVISTQKPSHTDMPKLFNNLTYRFVGKVSDANVAKLLAGQSGTEAHKLLGAGDFLKIVGPHITRFQAAVTTHLNFLPKGVLPAPFDKFEHLSKGVEPEILSAFLSEPVSFRSAQTRFNLNEATYLTYLDFVKRLKCTES